MAYQQFTNLATKSSRGRRGSVDVLLSSPVLCGISSILNCIIQDRSCLEEAAEEFNGEAKMFVPREDERSCRCGLPRAEGRKGAAA